MDVEDGHWLIQTDVTSLELMHRDKEELARYIKHDHARKLADRIERLMETRDEYRIETDSQRYTSHVYAFSPEQMKMAKQEFYGPRLIHPPVWPPMTDQKFIGFDVAKDETYDKDDDAAKAWRALWDELVKYNPEIAKVKGQSWLVSALVEIRRLQALDRTLEASLKARPKKDTRKLEDILP